MLLTTLAGSLLFTAAFSFRRADAAGQAPAFVTAASVFRLLSYAWLGCVLAPLNWALRHIAVHIAAVLFLDLLLLAYSFGLSDEMSLGLPPFGSPALRICSISAAAFLAFALARSMSGPFKAGAETTRLFGRQPKSGS